MTPFKYFKDKKELWEVREEPESWEEDEVFGLKLIHAYNSRPHFTVLSEPDWEDGKIVYEGKDFRVGFELDCEFGKIDIAIPLPKEKSVIELLQEREYTGPLSMPTPAQEFFPPAKPEQQDIPMEKEIRAAILGTLVIENKQSIDLAVKKILKIVSQSPKEEKE